MIHQPTATAERYPRTEAITRRWEEVAALPGALTLAALETTIRDLVVELLKSHLQLEADLSAAPEGYPGMAHDFETMRAALRELEQASLRMAQCWNRAGEKRGEGVSVAEVDAARQGVDVARKKALAVLKLTPAAFEPTHRHEDGGLYRLVTGSRYKTARDEHWSDCIIYEAAEDGKLYVTTPARWTERFTPISQPPKASTVPQPSIAFCAGCEWDAECGEAGECLRAMKVKP